MAWRGWGRQWGIGDSSGVGWGWGRGGDRLASVFLSFVTDESASMQSVLGGGWGERWVIGLWWVVGVKRMAGER